MGTRKPKKQDSIRSRMRDWMSCRVGWWEEKEKELRTGSELVYFDATLLRCKGMGSPLVRGSNRIRPRSPDWRLSWDDHLCAAVPTRCRARKKPTSLGPGALATGLRRIIREPCRMSVTWYDHSIESSVIDRSLPGTPCLRSQQHLRLDSHLRLLMHLPPRCLRLLVLALVSAALTCPPTNSVADKEERGYRFRSWVLAVSNSDPQI